MKTLLIVICGLMIGIAIGGVITGKRIDLATSFSFCLHGDKECSHD